MKESRRTRHYKFDRSFYILAIIIFTIIVSISFVNSVINGFTDERIVIILMNAWFILFTMNMITVRFKRQNEQYFWHNWIIFKQILKTQSKNSEQSVQNPADDDIKKAS
jgi:hypothetical protein